MGETLEEREHGFNYESGGLVEESAESMNRLKRGNAA